MASIWTAGFESNDFSEWSGTVFNEPQIDGGAAQAGSYGMYCNRSNAKELKVYDWLGGAADDDVYLEFYLNITTAPSAGPVPIVLFQAVGGGTSYMSIRINTDRTLELWSNSAQIGSDSAALSLATWHRIEVHCDTTQSAGSDVLEALLDGASFASSSSESLGSIGRIIAGYDNDASTKDLNFDSFEIDDASWVTGPSASTTPKFFGDQGLIVGEF